MRVLGLDPGTHRVGVAISDALGLTAQPLAVIDISGGQSSRLIPALAELCRQYEVTRVVLGMPLTLSGEDQGVGARRARAMGAAIEERLGLEVIYVDERFTTDGAERVLREGNVRRKARTQVVDKVAAALILQRYLDGQREEA
ncbi:MAG: Holliday junction resolvase RuvX [Proteobacteria bacterium]|nr:Holliday junction resolvase RuvX [Pseudomonadota bacterium]